jgi:Domain of unknown function (DUF4377)
MSKIFVILIFLFLNCSLAKKNNELEEKNIIEIEYYKVICQGESYQWCYLIKPKNGKAFEYQYDEIQGFKYEWGYKYILEIESKTIQNPAQDASSIKMVLKSILKKEKVAHNSNFILELKGFTPIINKKTNKITILDKEFDLSPSLKTNNLSKDSKMKFRVIATPNKTLFEVIEIK